jgi:peptidyl-prolyl cis-trans isomerase D
MLDDLRKKQKIIIYFVAVIFILGMGAIGIVEIFTPKPYLGKVDGTKITLEMYQGKIQDMYARFNEQNPNQPMDDNTRRSLEGQAWQELVDEILWDKQIKKHKIKVKESDILTEMQNNPPQELMQNESLQTNGRFDKSLYLSALKNNPEFFLMMEDYVRSYLPRKRLQEKIMADSGITIDSLKADYVKNNDIVNGKVLFFDFNNITEVEISDAEIMAQYEKDKEEKYKKGPATRVKYLAFSEEPSDKDFEDIKRAATEIRNRALAGESFKELAMEYSEDPGSGQNGGSLGVFGKGQMVPEFEAAAFALKEGEISEPVRTNFGWHVILCERIVSADPEAPQIEASHILFRVEASEATKRMAEEKALEAQKLVRKKGIEEAGKELEIEPTDTDWVAHDAQQIPGIGQNRPMLSWMVKAEAKAVSELFRDQQDRYIIAQVTENKKTYYEDFEKVKLRIKYELEKQKKIELTKPNAEAFFAQYSKDELFAKAEAEGWKVHDVENFKRGNSVPGIGMSEAFADAALQLNDGEISGLIHSEQGSYVIMATERKRPDLEAFTADEAKQQEIRDKMENAAWNRWFTQMRKDAKIVDNRAQFGM